MGILIIVSWVIYIRHNKKECNYRLRDNNIKYKLPVLCSREIPIKVEDRTPGSVSFVPNVAGFYIANYVFNDIISTGSDNNG